ncbi:hypothetical protein ZOSMA_1G00820 [Zostera marina]|uniref:Aspergillus nuclease S1 n=1 Tax=Zostera marina TaxID=29655 RepID=A0A0K9PMD3_ZOSMR|nr:hypothetical protein ZOSMA_1G00820 [Zostera marina]
MIGNCISIISMLLIINGRIAPANGWGKEGHFMVCKIAQKLLSNEASEAVLDLLPVSAGGELASVCSWPDNIQFHYRWSRPLHYINTPQLCNYKYSSMHLKFPSNPINIYSNYELISQEIAETRKRRVVCASPEPSITTLHNSKPIKNLRSTNV